MIVSGTDTIRTLDGTTVPTLMLKLILVARGALAVRTVERISVFCSVVRLPDAEVEPTVDLVEVELLAAPLLVSPDFESFDICEPDLVSLAAAPLLLAPDFESFDIL